MAVPEQTPYIEHTGNGVTTSFALKFQCESKDHLIVLVDGIEPPIATWSLTGGNVVFTTAPAAGKKITAQRNTPFSRNVDYQSYNNSFRPPAVNKDFDWIWWKLQELGVADWILGARIDTLKNYVDRKDDELKAYLMEEIRKQGVALDQLDDYYNYLMERLAQIAVDKGWDASFVVDGDKTQKEINDNQQEFKSRFSFPQDMGALGTNSSATVADWTVQGSSRYYPNLAAIQVDYPHVVSLSDTIDWAATQKIINDLSDNGGGTVNIPAGIYITNRPLEMKSFVNVIGATENVTIKKIADTANSAGKNCILYGNLNRRAKISGLTLIGNRTNYAQGNVVSMDGVYFYAANYMDVGHVRVESCNRGYYFESCWLITMSSTLAVICSGYGVTLKAANTSFDISNHTNWGTGGGYDIQSAQYTTITSAANDHIDYGGLPNDPFLPMGSGGDHKNPEFLFRIIGSQVSIISPGMENSATQYMYCEGSNVSINNPAVYTTVCHAAAFRFIQIRGTAKSTVNVIGADRLYGVTLADGVTTAFNRNMIYLERLGYSRQTFAADTLPNESVFGQYTIAQGTAAGVSATDEPSVTCSQAIVYADINQSNMWIGGGSPFISTGTAPTASVILEDGVKKLSLAGDASLHRIPLRGRGGLIMVNMKASVVAAGDLVIARVVDSDGLVIKQWQNSGAAIDLKYAMALSTSLKPLFFEIPLKAGQSVKIEHLDVQKVG